MTVQVLYWQDVPSVVKGPDGSKQQLPDSFQQEIDRRAMEQGLVGSDAYLEHWHWEEVAGTFDEVVQRMAASRRGRRGPRTRRRVRRVLPPHGADDSRLDDGRVPAGGGRGSAPGRAGVAWPMYGYDEARVRAPRGVDVHPPFRTLWTFHGHSLLEFPPVVGYGAVYLTTFAGRLFALDSATGSTLWSYRSHRCGWASPALARHTVYETFIGNGECHSTERDGEIAAFDAGSGAIRWLRHVGPTESSPLVVAGTVYAGDWTGRVWALDAATGRTRWTAQLHGAIKGSLALAGNRLFIGTYAGDVVALSARSGRVLWSAHGLGSVYSSPAVAYGRVYVGSLDGGVYAFGEATGHMLWARPTGGYVYASPAVWKHRVLVGSYDDHFYALDAGTGEVDWRFDAHGRISGAASVIGGVAYFSTFSQRTFALVAATGRELTAWPDGKYSPAVADSQRLYLVGLGRLYALAPRT